MPFDKPKTLETTQDRVLRQLCEALIFEGLVRTSGGAEWSLEKERFRAEFAIGGFDRPRIVPGSIQRLRADTWNTASLDDVVEALAIDNGLRTELRDDLLRTVHLTDLTQNTVRARGSRARMPYDALETSIDEGHPYHPCFKARSGFSDADNLAFGPEAAAAFQLHWLAVDRAIVHQTLPDGFWEAELGEQGATELANRVIERRCTDFALVPVHPWQMQKLTAFSDYRDWLASGRIAALGAYGDSYRATQSVRTLANVNDPARAHVKTSMAMRNSSSLRTIAPSSVSVAPAISDWLTSVLASDPLFGKELRLTILREYAGLIVGRESPMAGHLAAIYRESPQSRGLRADRVLPFNAMFLVEPDSRPLIDEWVHAYGLDSWLDQLLRVTILPVWHLMIAHGIGLEAHAQNLMLEHDNGWPTGLIARDFHESLEYVPALLSRPDLVPDLAAIDPVYADAKPDEFHEMTAPEALRELVMDTLFIYNLTELATLLNRHYRLSETLFWRRVRRMLDAHAHRHGLQDRQSLFDPFARRIFTESLMTLKLNGGKGVFRHSVANPLHSAKG